LLIACSTSEVDLLGGELAGLVARDGDGADDLAIAHHRNAQNRAKPRHPGELLERIFGVGGAQHVGDVDHRLFAHRPRPGRSAVGAHRIERARFVDALRVDGVEAGDVNPFAVEAKDPCIDGPGQSG
jgi:hypothetical protein